MAKVRKTIAKGTPLEIWFQDEARVGQKNKITRRWARRAIGAQGPADEIGLHGVSSGSGRNDTLSVGVLEPEVFAGEEDVRPSQR